MQDGKMEDLGESVVWQKSMKLDVLRTFLEVHRDVFDLEDQGENAMISLRLTYVQHRCKPKISGKLRAVHHE